MERLEHVVGADAMHARRREPGPPCGRPGLRRHRAQAPWRRRRGAGRRGHAARTPMRVGRVLQVCAEERHRGRPLGRRHQRRRRPRRGARRARRGRGTGPLPARRPARRRPGVAAGDLPARHPHPRRRGGARDPWLHARPRAAVLRARVARRLRRHPFGRAVVDRRRPHRRPGRRLAHGDAERRAVAARRSPAAPPDRTCGASCSVRRERLASSRR